MVMTPLQCPTAKYWPSLVQQQQQTLARILLLVMTSAQETTDLYVIYDNDYINPTSLEYITIIILRTIYSVHTIESMGSLSFLDPTIHTRRDIGSNFWFYKLSN